MKQITPKLTSPAEPDVIDGRLEHHPTPEVRVSVVAGGLGTHETVYGRRTLCRGDVILLRPGGWQAFVDCRGLRLLTLAVPPDLDAPPHVARMLFAPRLRDGAADFWVGEATLSTCLQRVDDPLDPLAAALASELDAASATLPHPAVAATVAVFERDVSAAWSVPALAGRVGIDPAYLSRLFRRDTGHPPLRFLNRRRAEAMAARLLTDGASVGEAGAAVGWPPGGAQTRRFRRHFGEAATTFRAARAA